MGMDDVFCVLKRTMELGRLPFCDNVLSFGRPRAGEATRRNYVFQYNALQMSSSSYLVALRTAGIGRIPLTIPTAILRPSTIAFTVAIAGVDTCFLTTHALSLRTD
jgi:hypothetical protein